MLPVDTKIWGRRVPGYIPDSEDEDDDSEEEEFLKVSEERFEAVVKTLGPKWAHTPIVEFTAPPLDQTAPSELKVHPPPTTSFSLRQQPPSFRIERVHAPIVSKTFSANGMLPTGGSDWVVQWSGGGIRDAFYQNLNEFQRVNHFPGSTELTRKDRLWEHFNGMKQAFGGGTFDFVPESFVLPEQVEKFLDCYERTNYTWIVKPNNSAQGKGIFLLLNLEDLPLDEPSVVSQYVNNPLLIQGLKFDLRIYVLVTSYTPLRAYVYREGLVRFASSPYSMDPAHLKDAYRHLTNYSVNKTAFNFVENQELENDNYGHKWSLSALNKHLNCVGVNCDLMWAGIMDLIVKTLLSVEPSIAASTRANTVHSNCFEVYGFDVLVDDKLKPWLLEVNLSPSMKADSPLDWKVKSTLLSDAFNLVGICSPDKNAMAASRLRTRMLQARQANNRNAESASRSSFTGRRGVAKGTRPPGPTDAKQEPLGRKPIALDRLSEEQLRMLAQALHEVRRCHNFIRLHPTRATCERYLPIWDARPRGPEPCDFFRLQQSSAARLLASVMFGPPPIGSAVGECRLSRLRCPLGSSSDFREHREFRESRELRSPVSPAHRSQRSNDSGTTKAPSDDISDAESDEDLRTQRLRLHQHKNVANDVRDSPALADATARSEVATAREGSRSFRSAPQAPRSAHLTSGHHSFRAAARAASRPLPRGEPPLRPTYPQRSISTPLLPKLLPEALSPHRALQNAFRGQWIQTDQFVPGTRAPTAGSGKSRRGQNITLEVLASNLNLDIEL